MRKEQGFSYLHLKVLLRMPFQIARFRAHLKLTFFTQLRLMTYLFLLKQTQEHLRSQRCKLRGTNREVMYASRDRLRRTVYTNSRFGLKSSGPIVTNRRKQNTIYSPRTISRDTYIRLPKRLIPRTSRWERNNGKLNNYFHYRHGAVVGRLTYGDVFAGN